MPETPDSMPDLSTAAVLRGEDDRLARGLAVANLREPILD